MYVKTAACRSLRLLRLNAQSTLNEYIESLCPSAHKGGQMLYLYEKVDELENNDMVGTHQCVALVQHYAGAPATSAWRQGDAVVGHAPER